MIIRDILDDDIEVAIKVGFLSYLMLSKLLKHERKLNYSQRFFGLTDLFRHLSIEKSK